MRGMITTFTLAAMTGLAAAPVMAEPEGSNAPPALSGEASLAWLRSTGSSERETFKGRLEGKHQRDAWTHEGRLDALRESDAATSTPPRRRYLASGKSSWNFTDVDYLFGKLQVERDEQSAFSYQSFAALGYGRALIKHDTMLLSAELGVGVRRSRDRLTRVTDDEQLVNGGLRFDWIFRPGASFKNELSVESGENSTVTRTRSALSMGLTQVLSLEVAYETKRDSGPADLRDSITTVGLAYRF